MFDARDISWMPFDALLCQRPIYDTINQPKRRMEKNAAANGEIKKNTHMLFSVHK